MIRRKHFLRSLTLWFNVVVAPALIVAEAHFDLLRPMLGEKTYGVSLFAVLVVNAMLRLKTNAAVGK